MSQEITQIVQFLTPFLPYLLKAGERAAEEAGKKLGADAWEQVKALWGKLRPKVEARPAAKEVLADIAQNPQDEEALAALRYQLKKVLEAEPDLLAEAARLVTSGHITGRVEAKHIEGEANGVKAGKVRGPAKIEGEVKAEDIKGSATGVSIEDLG